MNRLELSNKCQYCDELLKRIEDHTEGWDLEPRLRGHKDLRTVFYCYDFPDGVEPEKCKREEPE